MVAEAATNYRANLRNRTLKPSLARSRGPASFEARFEVAQDLVAVIDQSVLRDFLAGGQRIPEELAPPLGQGGLQLDGFDHERVWRLAGRRGRGWHGPIQPLRGVAGLRKGAGLFGIGVSQKEHRR